jgi:hypothetical protein
MRFVRGNVRDHIVTPKSTTALRSGTTERFSDREVKESTIARFSAPSDFRLFQHYRRNADIRYGTDVGKEGKKTADVLLGLGTRGRQSVLDITMPGAAILNQPPIKAR